MGRHEVIYNLRLSFQDFMDVDKELEQEFNKLTEEEQSKFISSTQNSISNGMNEGTDFSTVMGIVANMLAEDLIKINHLKGR